MKAESTVRPNSPFEIEQNADMATVIFYENMEEKQEEDRIKYTYDEYRIDIPYRPNLEESINKNIQAWLQKAIEKENEPKPISEKEKIAILNEQNNQLGVQISEREINEIVLGMQMSDLEIQILELQMGGI